jgi:hypothetical protein
MKRIFSQLDDEDHFGYICIGKEEDMPCPQLNLERKGQNLKAKTEFMKDICSDNYFLSVKSSIEQTRQKTKLNDALETAIKWQNNVDNTEIEHNKVAYDNTHTWIIAIVGSDEATIVSSENLKKKNKRLDLTDEQALKAKTSAKGNMLAKTNEARTDIHIIGMSPNHMQKVRVKQYRAVCDST